MPELPEVETIRKGLESALVHKKISSITLRRDDLRFPIPPILSYGFENQLISQFKRRSKYLLINFENYDQTIVFHLGMSGRMLIKPDFQDSEIEKHDHIIIKFDDGAALVYRDPRRFGYVYVIPNNDLETHKHFKHLGPEPFSEECNVDYLLDKLKGKSGPIKTALLNQEVIAGIGNIYANEALFLSYVSPFRAAKSLSRKEMTALLDHVRVVLSRAIEAGGSSLKDHRQANGEMGYFQHNFKVYNREGLECKQCTSGFIQRKTQCGRSTFYCNICQPEG